MSDNSDNLKEEEKKNNKIKNKRPLILCVFCDGVIYFLIFLFFFWIFCLNKIGVYEIGIVKNSRTGQMWLQDVSGWYLTSPFVRVATISLLPMKVELPSDAKIINEKLVRFNKEGWEQFIRMQGFYYYGSSLNNILLGFAFSGMEWSFLEILQEFE